MAAKLIEVRRPQFVAVLPKRKLVLMCRIGKSDPVCCLRSVWELMGVAWVRWELLVRTRCASAGLQSWDAKDNRGRRTLLVFWHKLPEVLEAVRSDVEQHGKPTLWSDLQNLMLQWPDKRRLVIDSAFVTRSNEGEHKQTPTVTESASESPKSNAGVLKPKPRRIKILRSVHKPEVLRLLGDGLNTVQIARAMGISRPAVSQIINNTYPYKHD